MSGTKQLPETAERSKPEGIQQLGFCLDMCDPLESQAASKLFGIQSENNLFGVLEYVIKATK